MMRRYTNLRLPYREENITSHYAHLQPLVLTTAASCVCIYRVELTLVNIRCIFPYYATALTDTFTRIL